MSDWTAEQDARLRKLWAEGETTVQIGKVMGRSKNAIIGRSHRLNLPSRPSPIRAPCKTSWSDKDKAKLRELNGLSHREAGIMLGRTLKAVKQMRRACGLTQPKSIVVPRPKPEVEATPRLARKPVFSAPAPRKPASVPAFWRPEPCCFVVSEGRPWRYCDQPSAPGGAYCAAHAAITHRRAPAMDVRVPA